MRHGAVLFTAFSVFFLTGCITRSIAPNYELKKGKESIVIGSISYPENGIPYITQPLGEGGTIRITTIIGNESRAYSVHPDKSGNRWTFYIAMPQGRFRIDEISWGGAWDEFHGSVNGIFTVYETGKIYYIGDIKLMQVNRSAGEMTRDIIFDVMAHRRSIPLNYTVIDGFQGATAEFFKRYPAMPRNVEKSLVKFKSFDKN